MSDKTMSSAHIRSGWNIGRLMQRGKLTDRKIAQYEKAGYYSAEFRKARKDLQVRRRRREGGFEISEDGRMIYNPR